MGELLVFGCPGCLRRPGCNGHLCLLFCIGLLLHWLLLQLLLLQLLLLLLLLLHCSSSNCIV